MLNTVRQRKAVYFGHLIRARGLQRLLLEGKVESAKRRGPQRSTWAKDIFKWTGMKYGECVRCADDRKKWRSMVANLGYETATD